MKLLNIFSILLILSIVKSHSAFADFTLEDEPRHTSSHNVPAVGQKKIRTAILGAALDPIHFGHVRMVLAVLATGRADEVWFVPSPQRPDKAPKAHAALRLFWADRVAERLRKLGFPVYASADEINFGEFRGSYHFINSMKKKYPNREFAFMFGTDTYKDLPRWNDPLTGEVNGMKLIKEFRAFLVPRAGLETPVYADAPAPVVLTDLNRISHSFFPDPVFLDNLSSSIFRQALGNSCIGNQKFIFQSVQKSMQKSGAYRVEH